MECLEGRGYTVSAIEWTGISHDRANGRLQVPQKIAKELGSGDDLPIHLTVRGQAGNVVFEGRINLGSGTEAYPLPGLGRHERVTVTARRL